jgi:hypothetical protein
MRPFDRSCDVSYYSVSSADPEDGGDMFRQNVGSYKSHMESSYPKNSILRC